MEHKIIHREINSLIFAEYNPRQLTKDQYQNLKDSISRFGLVDPIIVNSNKERRNIIIGGHQRVKVAKDMDIEYVPVLEIDLTYEKERELNIRLNKNTGEWDMDNLANFFDVDELIEWGFEESELILDIPEEISVVSNPKLADRFIVPPFSVLDARQGYWRERKKKWTDMGIRSELGRDNNLLGLSDTLLEPDPKKRNTKIQSNAFGDNFKNSAQSKAPALLGGTSIFDPVLCELSYRWFCPDGALILDPFAGGSVRGLVADKLGYNYTGIELREEQVKENQEQAKEIGLKPQWICGDSANVKKLVKQKYDFIFSCPPYYDLEVYSDLDGELSALKTYEEFIKNYKQIISDCVDLLNENRFACFVVGDIRDKKGYYRNFISDTIDAFQLCGAKHYNEMILVTPVGTVGMQTSRNFPIGRKVGKVHQNVLVFYKGDESKIKEIYPKIDVDIDENNIYGEELTLSDISGEIV